MIHEYDNALDNALRVSTMGMGQRSINALRMFFRGPCMNNYVLVENDENADVSIIDMDAYNSKQTWLDYLKKYPHRPTILESIKNINIDGTIHVRKPVDGKTLASALNKIKTQLQAENEGKIKEEALLNEPTTLFTKNELANNERTNKNHTKKAALTQDEQNEGEHFISKFVSTKSETHFLSLVDKCRQLDSGNLAVKNITQPIINNEMSPETKQNGDTYIATNIERIKLVKENKRTITNKKTKLPNRDPSEKIQKIHTGIVFDEVNNKYIEEENICDLVQEEISAVPILNDGFHFKSTQAPLSIVQPAPNANLKTTPTPNLPNIKDALKNFGNLNTEPKDNNEQNKHSEAGMFYDPSHYIQGFLKDAFKLALNNRKNVLLKGVLQSITILYQTREVFVQRNGESAFAMSERSLFALSSVPIAKNNMTISILTDSYDTVRRQDGVLFDYDLFMWKLASRASRGRLPAGTDLSMQMYLGKWPNISRLKLTPNALKVARLWAEKPCTLSMTAQMLRISQREVFTFLSAASALDLIKYTLLHVEPVFGADSANIHEQKQILPKESFLTKVAKKIRAIPSAPST